MSVSFTVFVFFSGDLICYFYVDFYLMHYVWTMCTMSVKNKNEHNKYKGLKSPIP